DGSFAGVVDGAVAYGSKKLGVPLVDTSAGVYGAQSSNSASGFSYLTAADGNILWHPVQAKVGTYAPTLVSGDPKAITPHADVRPIDGVRSIVGYAPLNLGQLLTTTYVDRPWLQWL